MNEYARYLAIKDRALSLPAFTGRALADQRVLVTGGTGCIGSELIRQLTALGCRKVGSIAIGPDSLYGGNGNGAVHYYHCDIRHRGCLQAIFEKGWDVVFHTAAQRDPGLAELEPDQTFSTNVIGTRNVLNAASNAGIQHFIHASTGKALRPYSPDTYTATKRIAEWLLSRSTIRYRSGARFTHVVDNSIVHRRMLRWAKTGRPIRLHADGIVFYAQSAIESAQLLLGAAEWSRNAYTAADIHAITDLEMPIDLTAMAHDLIQRTGSTSRVEFVGYDDGYEEIPFPGLYNPETACDLSPLINAFEAAVAYKPYPAVDAFPLAFDARELDQRKPGLDRADRDHLSWTVLDSALAMVEPKLADKVARLCANRDLIPEHDRMLAAIEMRAKKELMPV